jgi:hypothetical protein
MARKKKPDEIVAFKEWIASQGGEVLGPTNEWEVVRFRGNGETSIIYTNKKGQRTYTGQALEAFQAFKENKSFRLCKATTRKTYGREHPIDKAIRERDGGECFFCGKEFTSANPRTREHLVPTTAGGPNHITNMFHAHRACNARAGHLSAPEKIRIREANLYGAKQ